MLKSIKTNLQCSVTMYLSRSCRFVFLLVALTGVFLYTRVGTPVHVAAATSSNLNFQGRLAAINGSSVPDGFYNIQFKLYDASTNGSGSNLWTESYYDTNGVTAGNDFRVRVVNGYFSVNLGSQTAFPSLNWDQDMWLTMNVGGTTQTATPTYDGEMLNATQRTKLTAVPYAFRAGQLAKFNGTQSGTLGFNTVANSPNILLPDIAGTNNILLQAGTTNFTQGSIPFTDSTGRLTQDNANYFFDAANHTIGEGTTRTGAIDGTGNARVVIQGSGSTSSTSALNIRNSSGTSLLFVRDDGNVGIGTASPSNKLVVNGGDVYILNNGTARLILNSTSANGKNIFFNQNINGQGDTTLYNASDGNYLLAITSTGNTNIGMNLGGSEKLNIPNNNFLGAINNASSATIKLIGLNTSDQISIAQGGQQTIFGSGSVGIGTTAPTADLAFGGNAARTIKLEANTANAAGNSLTIAGGAAGAGAAAFTGGTLSLQGGAAGGTGNANGANVAIQGGTGIGTGAQGLVALASSSFTASATETSATSFTLAQSKVDNNSTIPVNVTAAGQTATLPAPTQNVIGRVLYITAVSASNTFTLAPSGGTAFSLSANSTATFIWNGSAWTNAGVDGGSSSYIQNQNASDQTGNFRITGTGRANTSILTPTLDAITAGTLSIGTATATTVTIGNTAGAAALNLQAGSGNVTFNAAQAQFSEVTGTRTLTAQTRTSNVAGTNITIAGGAAGAGAAAFTGGTLNLQGGAAGGTGNANGANVSLQGGAGVGTGVQGLVALSSASYTASGTQTFASSGTITQSVVDNFSTIALNITAGSVTVTVPAPTQNVIGRLLYVTVLNGSISFTIAPTGGSAITMNANNTVTLIWNGTAWTNAGLDGGSASTILNQNSSAQTGNFWINGSGRADTSLLTPLLQTPDIASGSSNSLSFVLRTGNIGTASGNTTGSITIKSGDASSSNNSSGAISIDSGTKSGSGTTGTISLGTVNASAIALGSTGVTTTNNGALTVTQTLTANGAVSVAANQNVTIQTGTGTFTQTYVNNVAGNAQVVNLTNSNTGAGVQIQGTNYTPTNTSVASSGTNILNVVNFAAGGALGASDQTNGLNFVSATGYTNFIKTPTAVLSSAGVLTGLTGVTSTTGTFTAANGLTLGTLTSASGGIVFNGQTSGTITLQAPTTAITSYSLKFPTAQGGAGTLLQNDGAGNLSWTNTAACTSCLAQVPATTAQNTITPTAASVVGLTVNGTSGTAATAVSVIQGGNATALSVSSSGTGNISVLNTTNATANGESITLQSGSSSQYAFKVVTNNAGSPITALNVRADGNVSIGTATPVGGIPLEVVGGNIIARFASGSASDSRIQLANSSTGGRTYEFLSIGQTPSTGDSTGSFALRDGTAGATRLTVDSTGNVGIGTTTPGAKLEVVSTATSASSANTISASLTNAPSGSTAALYNAINGYAGITGVNYSSNTNAIYGFGQVLGTSTSNIINGIQGIAQAQSGGQALAATGIRAGVQNVSTGTVISGIGLKVDDLVNSSTGTFTNTYGVYIGSVTAGTQTNQAYGLYQQDIAARNYFGGSVGIGTASPGSKLDVKQTGGLSALSVRDEFDNLHLQVYGNGSIFQFTNPATAGSPGISSPGLNIGSSYWNGSSSLIENFRLAVTRQVNSQYGGLFGITNSANTSNLVLADGVGGEVAVGYDFPSEANLASLGQLHVRARAATTVGFSVQGATSQSADLIRLMDNTSTVISKFDSAGHLSVGTATSVTGGVATFNGNVGIGTTAPNGKLDISTATDQILDAIRIGSTANGYNGAKITFKGAGASDVAQIQGSYSIDTSTGDLFLRGYRNSLLQDALTVKGSGNVGIGTTTPTGLLQVAQTTTANGAVITNGTTTLQGVGTTFLNTFKVGDTINVSGETARTITAIASDTNLTVSVAFSTSTSGLTYTLAGGTRLTVQGNGNVGIGTVSPGANLEVSSSGATVQRITSTNNTSGLATSSLRTANGNGFDFTFNPGANQLQLGQVSGGALQSIAMYINLSTGATLFRPSADGVNTFSVTNNATTTTSLSVDTLNNRVGIGTAAPSSKLHVIDNSTGFASQIIQNNTAGYGEYIFVNHQSSTIDAFRVQGWNGSSVIDGLNVKGNGNVGIGTATANSKLTIQGDAGVQAASISGNGGTGTSVGLLISAGTNASDFGLNVRAVQTGNSQLFVRGDGNVGISVGTPQEKLNLGSGSNIAINLGAPGTITPTATTTGGSLASGTYYYKVTALDGAGGETIASPEASTAVTGPNGKVSLSWSAITGANSYRIYRGTSANGENTYYSSGTGSGTTIAAVQNNQVYNNSTATTTATFASTPVQNHLLVAIHHAAAANSALNVSTPAGWTKGPEVRGNGVGNNYTLTTMFYKIAGASEPTAVTVVSPYLSAYDLSIFEYSGNDTNISTVLDTSVTSSINGPGSPITFPSITTNGANDIIVGAVGTDASVGVPTFGNTWTNSFARTGGVQPGYFSEITSRLNVGPGTYSTAETFTPNNVPYFTTVLAAFKSAYVAPNSLVDTGAAGTAGSPPTVTTAYVNKLSASGNSWLQGGNIGIGTVSPNNKLSVLGGIAASGSITGGVASPDYAENITATDLSIEAADVVSLDPTMLEHVIKSAHPYELGLLGVISTHPGFVTNAVMSAIDGTGNDAAQRPLALSGRVPVKVTNENGPIKAGDYLTSSSTPGYAMKATKPGPTIGKAMEDFNGTTGKVIVFISSSYANPNDQNLQASTGSFDTLNIVGETKTGSLKVTGTATVKDLVVTGTATVQNITVVDSISTKDLIVTGTATIEKLVVKDATVTGSLTVEGGIRTAIAQKSAGYTLGVSDSIITGDAVNNDLTFTLPTAVGIAGRQYTIKKVDNSTHKVTLLTNVNNLPNGTPVPETIDGAPKYELLKQYKYILVVSDGTNWIVVGNN